MTDAIYVKNGEAGAWTGLDEEKKNKEKRAKQRLNKERVPK